VSLNGKKLSTVTRDNLYAGLFGPRTLKYWQDKDDMPSDPEEVMWEESRLTQKRMPFGSRRIDAKVRGDALTILFWACLLIGGTAGFGEDNVVSVEIQ
jgi:hypothetical protein